jgi:hypothetical protein
VEGPFTTRRLDERRPIEIRVTSAEVSVLLSKAYDAGFNDGAVAGIGGQVATWRSRRLFELIRDWSFERRLREIAAAGPIVKGDLNDAN